MIGVIDRDRDRVIHYGSSQRLISLPFPQLSTTTTTTAPTTTNVFNNNNMNHFASKDDSENDKHRKSKEELTPPTLSFSPHRRFKKDLSQNPNNDNYSNSNNNKDSYNSISSYSRIAARVAYDGSRYNGWQYQGIYQAIYLFECLSD